MSTDCYTPIAIAQAFFFPEPLSTSCLATLMSDALSFESSFTFYAQIFALTCLLESPIYFIVGKFLKRPTIELIQQIFVLNLATHPIVCWVIPFIAETLQQTSLVSFTAGEVFAPTVEILLLRFWAKYPWKSSVLASISANLFSWWFGLWILEHIIPT